MDNNKSEGVATKEQEQERLYGNTGISLVNTGNESEDNDNIRNNESVRIRFNDEYEKIVSLSTITGNGRGANSILAMQILGTYHGMQGSTNLQIDEEFIPVVDLLLQWLGELGDGEVGDCLKTELNEENASLLHGLAQYFGLTNLEKAIEEEKERRDKEEEEKEQSSLIEILRLLHMGACTKPGIRCVRCGKPTTVAPTYRGNTPRCRACRFSGSRNTYSRAFNYDSDDSSYSSY